MARARNETVPPFPTGKKLAAISPVDERCMFDDARNANRLSRSIIGGGCPRRGGIGWIFSNLEETRWTTYERDCEST